MESTTLICKRCKAPLEYEEGESVAKCPSCGYSELIAETDEVKIGRIRAKAYKDIEIKKHKIAADASVAEKSINLEKKKISFKMGRLILIASLVVIVLVAGLVMVYNYGHRDKLKMPLSSEAYCLERSYERVRTLLLDAGFEEENIELVPQETLTKDQQQQVGLVSEVSINGKTDFTAGTWFPKNAVVKILYLAMDPNRENDLMIPVASVDCVGKNYREIENKFREAGFSNIIVDKFATLTMEQQNEVDKVTKITVSGAEEFSQGKYVPYDTQVYILYKVLDPERETDIYLSKDYDFFIGVGYTEAIKEFQRMGFSNITLLPQYDLGLMDWNQNGIVQKTSVNNNEKFFNGVWLPVNTEVTITYRTDKMQYSGEKLSDVIEKLQTIGFSNIEQAPLADLSVKDIKKADTVESVTIENADLNSADSLNLLSKVVVAYHSEMQAGDNQVKMSYSSQDLIGRDYKEVVDSLKQIGFTNVSARPLEDIVTGWLNNSDKVGEVSFDGSKSFSVGEIFDKNIEIVVSYHSRKEEPEQPDVEVRENQTVIGTSSADFAGKNYIEVRDALSDLGFSNILVEVEEDLVTGWLSKEGDVKEISINGNADFSVNDVFDLDAEIIIRYHAFPKKWN